MVFIVVFLGVNFLKVQNIGIDLGQLWFYYVDLCLEFFFVVQIFYIECGDFECYVVGFFYLDRWMFDWILVSGKCGFLGGFFLIYVFFEEYQIVFQIIQQFRVWLGGC